MKGQIKMGETIAVMVIFFYLVVFGFSFYTGMQQRWYEDELNRQLELRVLQITQKASYIPELQCSIQNIQYDNCFDIQKAAIFSEMLKNDPALYRRYYDIFRFSKIEIKEVYPDQMNITVYNHTMQNATDTLQSMVPVSLFNGSSNMYSMGVLEITYYKP